MFASSEKKKKLYQLIWLVSIFLAGLLIWKFAFYPLKKEQPAKRPTPVSVVSVKQEDIPLYLTALGSVTPNTTVTVRTQISGQLLKVHFQEGKTVKMGDLLAEVDPRPYQAELQQLEGQLGRDQALLTNAKLDLERYKKLALLDAVSKQTYDSQVWLVKQLEGTVKSDEGQIEGVKLNLDYCRIKAPIGGRVGFQSVDEGNYVQVSDPNGIVVLNATQPIHVVFPIPEDNIQDVLEQINDGHQLQVEVYDRWQNKQLATGKLVSFDNQIDTSTGTVKLKAEFENKDNRLFPNQFVNVQLLIKTLPNAVVVPTATIQRGTQGAFVYVVSEKNTVQVKPVVVVASYKDQTVITGNVQAGQLVVIEGTDKLSDGDAVQVAPVKKLETQGNKNG